MAPHLLPGNATRFEQAMSLATDSFSRLDAPVARGHGIKFVNTPSTFLPYLVFEYGLGELSPYVPNLYDLISEGIQWQRVRGTPAAMARALNWLNYAAAIEEWPTRRRKWNLFMLALDRVRGNEIELPRIDGVANLSVPLRSYFWRGFHGYDVRALDFGRTKYGQTLYGAFSGARIPGANAKWSYGRRYEKNHVMTQAELTDLDVWLEPVEDVQSAWPHAPWPHLPWQSTAAVVRSDAMINGLPQGGAWAVFKDSLGEVIGYRRARARHRVAPALDGVYRIGTNRYSPNDTGTRVYLEAMTDFGDGYGGADAASVGFILGGEPVDLPPGSRWLPPGGLSVTGPILAEMPASIPFGRTVRERVSALLRF